MYVYTYCVSIVSWPTFPDSISLHHQLQPCYAIAAMSQDCSPFTSARRNGALELWSSGYFLRSSRESMDGIHNHSQLTYTKITNISNNRI